MGTITVGAGQSSTGGTVTQQTLEMVEPGGLVTGITVEGGSLIVSNGATASAATVSDGYLTVFGFASGTMVEGASLSVSGTGTIAATTVTGGTYSINGTTAPSRGYLDLGSGGTATGVDMENDSRLDVGSGGIATDVTVGPGDAEASVSAGGVLSAVNLNGASLTAQDGASLTGTVTIGAGRSVIELGDNTSPAAVITGFTGSDLIILDGVPYSAANTLTISGDVVTVGTPGGITETLTVAGAQSDGLTLGYSIGGMYSVGKQVTELMVGGTGATATNGTGATTMTTSNASTINLNGTNNTVNAGAGTTIVYASGTADTAYGGSGPLVFVAGGGSYLAGGGSGSDTLYGGAGADTLVGGSAGGNVLVAGSGNTTLQGGGGNGALMFGGAGQDVFSGSGGGGDTMVGGAGGNAFTLTARDVAFGGPGSADTVTSSSAGAGALFVAGSGTAQVRAEGGSLTAFDGTGSDTYVLFKGADTQLSIVGFKNGDHLYAAGGFTVADVTAAAAHATTGAFGTTLGFSDGTHVTLFGVSPAALAATAS